VEMNGIKLALIGGGSSYTPNLIVDAMKVQVGLPIEEICLMDFNKKKLKIVTDFSRHLVSCANANLNITMATDRKAALRNSDFIITLIRPGGLVSRSNDIQLALRHNLIGQETQGIGGFASSLRTIPPMLEIAKDIEKYAPKAWVVNGTNPAGIITETLSKKSNINVIGLCDVPFLMRDNFAQYFKIGAERISFDWVGLNHLSWARKVFLDGRDVLPSLLKGLNESHKDFSVPNIPDLGFDYELIKTFKMVPSPYLRYYYHSEEILEETKKAKRNRAEVCMEIAKELFKIYEEKKEKGVPKIMEKRGGAHFFKFVLSIINAIHNNKNEIHVVNIKNNDALPQLPPDVVVEVSAVINKFGARALKVPSLETRIRGLIQQVKAYEELTIEAAITRDYDTALNALLSNPLVGKFDTAKNVLDELLETNKEYLKPFK